MFDKRIVLEIPLAETQTKREEPKSSWLDITIGSLFLILVLPVMSYSLRELADVADSLEYGAYIVDMENSMI